MAISQLFPEEGPTLNLNFAGSRTLDPRITFIRTTAGTRTNELGLIEVVPANAPRFDHSYDPVSGSVRSLGLLVEEQRTNLVTHNATDFNYSIYNQIIATALDTAPDGNIVLCKHDLTGATSPFLNCRANTTLSSGNTYTMSMWLKGTTNFSASFAFVGETISEIYYNTANVTTEWKRFTLTFTLTNTQTLSRLQVFFAQQGEGKVISIWGAQLELGSFATTYIPRPTAGQQATRTADNAKIDGNNFTNFYNPSEGTIFCSANNNPGVTTTTSRFFYAFERSDGTSADFIRKWISNGNTGLLLNSIYTSNSGSIAADFNTSLETVNKRTAIAYKQNDFARSYNGSSPTTDNVGNIPVGINQVRIGTNLSGHISQLTYYPVRLPNQILQNLTK